MAEPAKDDDTDVTRPMASPPVEETLPQAEDATLIAEGRSAAGAADLPQIPELAIEGELGRGGMGVVYRGRQTYIDRVVAVKVLEVAASASHADFVKRFQREAKLLARFDHPHIVRCFQAGITAGGCPYLVMEFIDGCTLRQQIERHGPLDQRSVLLIGRDLARALGHAHEQGIIHRDVKPENVLLQQGTSAVDCELPYVVKLADLGLARPGQRCDESDTSALTAQGMIMGTPATMAPEQFDDPDAIDFRCDIYGLGCVLHHALNGQPAFTGKTLNQLLKNKITAAIPDTAASGCCPPVARLVGWCLEPDRARRPASYPELIEAIDRALVTVKGGAGGSVRRQRPWRVMVALAGLLLALLAGGIAAVAVIAGEPADGGAPTPQPLTVSPRPPVELTPAPAGELPRFGPPQPLWGEVFDTRLAEWTAQPPAAWASHDERADAIFGAAFGPRDTATLSRELPAPPWRISVTLAPVSADGLPPMREAGLWLREGGGRAVGVVVQCINDQLRLAAIRERPGPEEPARTLGEPRPLGPASEGYTFILTASAGRVLVSHADAQLGDFALGDPISLDLRVEGGGVEVHRLDLAAAVP